MAKKIIWSSRAISSFDKIINYLEKEWTQREIAKLVQTHKKS
jgi:plasmid stabilization system protein ParE